MNEVLYYLVEVVAIHAIFFIFYKMVIERENHFRFNRFYLLSSSLLSAIIPLLSFRIGLNTPVISRVMGLRTITLDTLTVGAMNTGSGIETGNILANAVILIYSTGLLFLLWKLGIAVVEFLRVIRSTQGTREANYIIYDTGGEFPSFSFLHHIFINRSEDMDNADYQRILLHEKVHADQWHSLDLLFIEFLRIVFWFNPFVWIYRKLIVETDEYLADEGVLLESGFEDYASLIVNQVFHTTRFQFVNYFFTNTTLKRIQKMKTIKKPSYIKLLTCIPLMAGLILFFSCDNNMASVKDNSLMIAEEAGNENSESVGTEIKNQPIEIMEGDTIYRAVDTPPKPVGGLEAMYKTIADKMTYPQDAKENGIEGKVFIEFVVRKDGSITDIKTIKGISESCDKEAERVVRESTTEWIPGEHRGTKLNVRMVLPIQFKLD